METPLRQLHITHRASSCAKRGGHVQLCSKPRGARGIKPETFRRGQLLSRPPTTGPDAAQSAVKVPQRQYLANTLATQLTPRVNPHKGGVNVLVDTAM